MNFMFSNQTIRTSQPVSRKPTIGFSNIFEKTIPTYNTKQPITQSVNIVKNIDPASPPNEPKKVIWGEPVWFLLHTLAEKVKPESFSIIKKELLQNIYTICTNLPCPDCSNHAKIYLDDIRFLNILTRDDLKNALFEFHNSVNIRKGYPLFNRAELDSKYKIAITKNIIIHFMNHFQDKYRSPKLISSDLYRSRIAEMLKQWFNKNLHYFN